MNLFQLINEPTRLNSLLDLIITDSPGYVDNYGTLPPISNIDHRIIFGSLTIKNLLPPKIHRSVWHYNNADFQLINQELTEAPWDTAYALYDNIDDILDFYYSLIDSIMEEHIPKRNITKNKHDKPWMNGFLNG